MLYSSRKGFTLVEMLVVIAIIGILTAIAVPAVMQATASARKTYCLNNLRQMGAATISYQSTKQSYPSMFTTWVNPGDGSIQLHPYMVELFPELDQQNLFDQVNAVGLPGPGTGGYVAVLNCPSDPTATRRGPEFTYAVNAGRPDVDFYGNGVYGLDIQGTGLFYDRSQRGIDEGPVFKMNSTRIKDGQGTTLMYSENSNIVRSNVGWGLLRFDGSPAIYVPGDPTTGHQEFEFGMIWTGAEPNPNYFATGRDVPFQTAPSLWYYARPSSFHSQGFNVVFADGRTDSIANNIGYDVYCRLLTPDGAKALVSSGNDPQFAIGVGRVDEALIAK